MQAPAGCRADRGRGCRPAFEVRDWTRDHANYFRAIRIEKTMMALILLLIVAVAAFNIVAMLVMVVTDKRTDIAILRTLGASPRRVMGVFLTQGLVIGWFGVALGVGARRRAGAERRRDRAGARARVRLPGHEPGRLLHHAHPLRAAVAQRRVDRRRRAAADRPRDGLSGAAGVAGRAGRSAAVRVSAR